MANTNIGDLILSACTAVGGVLVFSFIGWAYTKTGAIDRTVIQSLGAIVYLIMEPAYFLHSVSSTVDVNNFVQFWPLPVFSILNLMMGTALGFLVVKMSKPPEEFRKAAIVSVAVPNVA
eukprot:TRINITY_DN1106_c0_g1_i1.p1 TRINITY_DN1106_c0_g1~~TRINITY_DN1106_c0_g1_i1.p1  ORF type:complete len:119 (-),score=10.62 TRINITY_DN1106_c0_g1_i1:71-427(-)